MRTVRLAVLVLVPLVAIAPAQAQTVDGGAGVSDFPLVSAPSPRPGGAASSAAVSEPACRAA